MYCSEGANVNKCYNLDDEIILVGRASTNDIVVKDGACSRKQAIIIVDNGVPYIVSVKDSNPVIVDGKAIMGKERLYSGQTITMGETWFHMLDKDGVKPASCESTHSVMNNEVREALREIMNKDLHKVSCSRTTRIKSSDLISA